MFEEHLHNTFELLRNNTTLSVLLFCVLAALFISRAKEMFKLTAFVLFLVIVFYLMTLLIGTVDTGSRKKDRMIHKSKDLTDD